MASGKTDYLRKKPGTINWSVRFQYPPALRDSARAFYGVDKWPKEREKNLGTWDELEARRLAQPAICEFQFNPARHSDAKPAMYSDLKPATVPI